MSKKHIANSGHKNFAAVAYNCDNCGAERYESPHSHGRNKRHFCDRACYAQFRKERLPKEEQNAYGSGHSPEERAKRRKARTILNHYLRDNKIERPGCEVCGEKSEAHHDNYDKPLEVKWLCMSHHREYHKKHPHLTNPTPSIA